MFKIFKNRKTGVFGRLRKKSVEVNEQVQEAENWFDEFLPGYSIGMKLLSLALVISIFCTFVTPFIGVEDEQLLILSILSSVSRISSYVALLGAGLCIISLLPLLTPAGWSRFEV